MVMLIGSKGISFSFVFFYGYVDRVQRHRFFFCIFFMVMFTGSKGISFSFLFFCMVMLTGSKGISFSFVFLYGYVDRAQRHRFFFCIVWFCLQGPKASVFLLYFFVWLC